LTEIYLCHACSYHEIEDANAWAGFDEEEGARRREEAVANTAVEGARGGRRKGELWGQRQGWLSMRGKTGRELRHVSEVRHRACTERHQIRGIDSAIPSAKEPGGS
jgi:hypothetical protein